MSIHSASCVSTLKDVREVFRAILIHQAQLNKTMTVGEIRTFLKDYSDDTIVYADGHDGMYLIEKELCGCFVDRNNNRCPSLHLIFSHSWGW